VTVNVLRAVFGELYSQLCGLEGMILRPNMCFQMNCPPGKKVSEVGLASMQYAGRFNRPTGRRDARG